MEQNYWIILPHVICNKVADSCINRTGKFSIPKLLTDLSDFISKDLNDLDPKLTDHYKDEIDYLTTDILKRALNGRKDSNGIFIQKNRKLLDLLCYYAFSLSWSDTLIELNLDIEHISRRSTTKDEHKKGEPLPSFKIETDLVTQLIGMPINFKGRDEELQLLKKFCEDEATFLWWGIWGDAGAGKTRLVEEFCIRSSRALLNLDIVHLFQNANIDWINWYPLANTLIVIDNLSITPEKLIEIIAIVKGKSLFFSVRIIIVGREESKWIEDFTSRCTLYNIHPWKDFLKIKPLSESNLLSIINQVLTVSKNKKERIDLLNKLKEIDSLRRPLYAVLIAQSSASNNSKRGLIEAVFIKEKISWEKHFIQSTHLQLLYRKYLNLAVLLTISGGFKSISYNKRGDDVLMYLPSATEIIINDLRIISPSSNALVLSPIKPDLFGEFFVVNFLKDLSKQSIQFREIISSIATEAWIISRSHTGNYITALLIDYPDEIDILYDLFVCILNGIKHKSFYSLNVIVNQLVNTYRKQSAHDKSIEIFFDVLTAFEDIELGEGEEARYYYENISAMAYQSFEFYLKNNELKHAETLYAILRWVIKDNTIKCLEAIYYFFKATIDLMVFSKEQYDLVARIYDYLGSLAFTDETINTIIINNNLLTTLDGELEEMQRKLSLHLIRHIQILTKLSASYLKTADLKQKIASKK